MEKGHRCVNTYAIAHSSRQIVCIKSQITFNEVKWGGNEINTVQPIKEERIKSNDASNRKVVATSHKINFLNGSLLNV